MSGFILKDKSYSSAVESVNLFKVLQIDHKEYVLTILLGSRTVAGAWISETKFGQSKLGFVHKLSIALNEANERRYWLNLLHDTNYLDKTTFTKLPNYCAELIRILIARIKTTKSNKS